MDNFTAGAGDPYWYEWSVGLLYTVKMLNPDNRIKNVVLQADASHSLDDVVVTYEDGVVQYIQVKNTREDDKLTYSDMIEGELEKSYLYKYSSEWKMMEDKNKGKNRVILFTNRKIGDRKYTPKNKWERPSLSMFWESIKKQADDLKLTDNKDVDITKILVKNEWEEAWNTWKEYMKDLNAKEQLLFLQNFELVTDQEDLDGLVDTIANELQVKFKTTHEKAVGLHQKLCYQLIWWSTSIGNKKDIEKEDVMQALSLSGDYIKGEHIFPICEPFFCSRIKFIESLENKILNGKKRIIFLTGNPGCGKTNIISYLACKPNSIITLRFYAFKPIIPGELYISADSGISDPKDFWGSLLIMLRELFKGKLYEYNVPISIELVDSIDVLRDEVFRLSSAWADITGQPTVIAIDGIDHAARSGDKNTFLRTLLQPEAVPLNVRLILAGQPVHQFSEYPDFLSDIDRIETIDVPDIEKSDLGLLYEKNDMLMQYNEFEKELIINYIAKIAKGSTLSAVFAMQEATKYSCFDDFEKSSNVKTLSSSIQSYYEYIWKTALKQAGDIGYTIDMYLSVSFSVINRKISAQSMADIFESEIAVWKWEDILQNLYPIIIYDEVGYSVFHNDVRIFLTAHNKKAKQLLPHISGKIAEYLLCNDFDERIKHEILFRLLKDAKKEERYVDVFNCEYVMKAYLLKQNPREIQRQMLATLAILPKVEDKRKIVNFSCAVTTMQQHDESLRFLDTKYQYDVEIPFALHSERRLIVDNLLYISDFKTMFKDIELLIQKREHNRARRILERWMSKRTPDKLFNYLIQSCEEEAIYNLMEMWGKYSRTFKLAPKKIEYEDYKEEIEKHAAAHFYKGWLKEAVNYEGNIELKYTLENAGLYFNIDIEDFLQHIIKNGKIEDVEFILKEKMRKAFSEINQLSACAWAIRNKRSALCKTWIQEIKNKEFDFISEKGYEQKYSGSDREIERFKAIADLMYVLAYISEKKINDLITGALEKSGFEKERNDNIVARNILVAIHEIAYIEQYIQYNCVNKLSLIDFKTLLDIILNEVYYNGCFRINTIVFRKKILISIIQMIDMLPQVYNETLKCDLCTKALSLREVALFECYWGYLHEIGRDDLIEHFFDTWMDNKGNIWKEELSERKYISDTLLKIAEDMNWQERIKKAVTLLNARAIGYVGHKEYSLFNPLYWFERIAKGKKDIWKTFGCLLMNISEYASRIGDNRAFIQIGGTVVAVVGKMGPNSLLQFTKMVKKSETDCRELLFDGIISALENGDFTEQELLLIWKKTVEQFAINEFADQYNAQNNRNKIYCADVHEAISLCAQRLCYANIEAYMKELASCEYNQKRLDRSEHSHIIPNRWYETENYINMEGFIDAIRNMTCDEIFAYIEKQLGSNDFSWDYIRYFIRMAQKKDSQSVLKYKLKIMKMLDEREVNTLEYDGCNRLYEVLFPYLTDDEVANVLDDIIRTYYHYRDKGWPSIDFGLMTDLEHFTFALFTRFGIEDNMWALEEILKMHCLWLNGTEKWEIEEFYQMCEEEYMVGWSDFLDKLDAILIW